MTTIAPTPAELGRVAYDAYGDERDWKVYGGAPMPTWETQSEELRAAWIKAAVAVADHLVAALGI